MTIDACFVCDKHRRGAAAEGGVTHEDDLVYAGHAHLVGPGDVYYHR